jgi:hypothetical protein
MLAIHGLSEGVVLNFSLVHHKRMLMKSKVCVRLEPKLSLSLTGLRRPLYLNLCLFLYLFLCLGVLWACEDSSSAKTEEMVGGVMGGVIAGAMAGAMADQEDSGGDVGGARMPAIECALYTYDPLNADLSTFPDDTLTTASMETTTGIKLNLSGAAWVADQSAFVQKIITDLDTLDGWGINAGILVRFSAPLSGLPSGAETAEPDSSIKLLMLDGVPDPPRFPAQVPVEVRGIDGDRGLIFEPMLPLRSSTRYGLAIRELSVEELTIEGEAPSACLDARLSGSNGVMDELLSGAMFPKMKARYTQLLEGTGWSADELAVGVTFTTQSATETSLEIAEDIRTHDYAWGDPASCEEDGEYILCTRLFTAHDYRTEGVIQSASPQAQYDIKVYSWIPQRAEGVEGAMPTILFGHGIGGSIDNAYLITDDLEGEPVIIMAIDALAHGEHPTSVGGANNGIQSVLDFFSLNLADRTINALEARDHFRQSTYDKLQLIELLHQDPDLDGDGSVDVDLSALGYFGLSLGGIMGVELLALEPRIDLSILAVAGAKLLSVLSDGELIIEFLPIIHNLVGGKQVFDAFIPLAQTVIDAADPGTYAPYVLSDRLVGTRSPHLLMQMAIDDGVVPNPSNRALARGLQLPHVTPIAQEVGLLEETAAPASLNVDDRTVGLFQFDKVKIGTSIIPSSHSNVPYSPQSGQQNRAFIRGWVEDQAPVIINPYGAP